MPEVHFVGEIESGVVHGNIYSNISTSITWALCAGNAAWALHDGYQSGETQTCLQGVISLFIFSFCRDININICFLNVVGRRELCI